MNITDFVQKFAEQFEETELSIFTPQTKFRELDEWSSLTALSIIAMIDEEYGMSLKSNDLMTSETVEDIYRCISE